MRIPIIKMIKLGIFISFLFLFSAGAFAEEKPYYGTWEFDHVDFHSRISAGDEYALQSYGHTTLICQENYYCHRGQEITDFHYVEEIFEKDEFAAYFRVQHRILVESGGRMIRVKIIKEEQEIASFFYDEGRDRVLGWREGVFIGAHRVP